MNSSFKQNLHSGTLNSFIDSNESDDLFDDENISDTLSTSFNPSILSVKSIIPSAGPAHINHHLLQHH